MTTTIRTAAVIVTLTAGIALSGCTVQTSAPETADAPAPVVESAPADTDLDSDPQESAGDGIDEYDTDQLLALYEQGFDEFADVITLTFTPDLCWEYYNGGDAWFWDGFFNGYNGMPGFWASVPDELAFILTETDVMLDLEPIIHTHCMNVS